MLDVDEYVSRESCTLAGIRPAVWLHERVVLARADGGVSIMRPIQPILDVDDEVAKWSSTADPWWFPLTATAVVHRSTIPTDRRWRNAWIWDGERVVVSLDRARVLRVGELRIERRYLMRRLRAVFDRLWDRGQRSKLRDLSRLRDSLRRVRLDRAVQDCRTLSALGEWEPGEFEAVRWQFGIERLGFVGIPVDRRPVKQRTPANWSLTA